MHALGLAWTTHVIIRTSSSLTCLMLISFEETAAARDGIKGTNSGLHYYRGPLFETRHLFSKFAGTPGLYSSRRLFKCGFVQENTLVSFSRKSILCS